MIARRVAIGGMAPTKEFEVSVQEVLRRLVEAEILRGKGLRPIGFAAPTPATSGELGRVDSNHRFLG